MSEEHEEKNWEKNREEANQGKKTQTERNQKEKIQRRSNQTKKGQEETTEDLNKQFHPAFCEAMLQIFEKEADPEGKNRIQSIFDLAYQLNNQKKWMKEMIGMGALRDLF